MSKRLIVVGLGGSLAENSKSRAALQVALEGAADAGAETQLLDLRRLDLPMYNPEEDEPTETAATLIEAAYAANGLLCGGGRLARAASHVSQRRSGRPRAGPWQRYPGTRRRRGGDGFGPAGKLSSGMQPRGSRTRRSPPRCSSPSERSTTTSATST
jgi:NADPH-dependent FMN reductase